MFASQRFSKQNAALAPEAMRLLLSKRCSRDEFTLLIIRLIEERMHGFGITAVSDSELRITSPEGKQATTYLDNVWSMYQRVEENEREGGLERYLRVMVSLLAEPAPLQKEQIVATIKDAGYMGAHGEQPRYVYEPLCADLYVVYMQDLPDRMSTIGPASLEALGIELAELRSVAKENLRRILGPANRFGDGPWWMLACGDYTASLLLMEKLWDGIAKELNEVVVAVAPARDVLLYTAASSEAGLQEIRRMAQEVTAKGDHVISETLVVWREGQWLPFLVQ